MESKYTIGLLAASCVLLIVAIAITVVEITQYTGGAPQARAVPAEPSRAVPTPEEAPEKATEAPPEAGEEPAE